MNIRTLGEREKKITHPNQRLDEGFDYTHRSGSGRKTDFGSQQEFQWQMIHWVVGFNKIQKLKKSTGGPSLLVLGFQAVFGKNRVKNNFYANLAL